MEKAFWQQRWQEGRIGFHQDEVHLSLTDYWCDRFARSDDVVFVPLCGKSRDMVWLADQGCRVIGVELSEKAVTDFFREQQLTPEYRQVADQLDCYSAGPYEIYCGDFFHLHRQHLVDVTAVYDRAALVALPTDKRHRYAFHLAQMLSPAVRMLLVSLEHPRPSGPPFSVGGDEIEWLFAANFAITPLATLPEDDRQVSDVIYQLVRKGRESVTGRKSPGL